MCKLDLGSIEYVVGMDLSLNHYGIVTLDIDGGEEVEDIYWVGLSNKPRKNDLTPPNNDILPPTSNIIVINRDNTLFLSIYIETSS